MLPSLRPLSLFRRALLAGLMGAIIWFYGWTVTSNSSDRQPLFGGKQRDYNNLLAHAFLGGHLYLPIQPDPRLLRAEDPYNPEKREGAFVLHDASFYRGRYYIYFGVTPVVMSRLPWRLATGHDLPQNYAILISASVGFIAAVILLLLVRWRYFPEAGFGLLLAQVAVLGLASMNYAVLRRTSTWEEPIASGYCYGMLTLLCLYQSLHARRAGGWLAAGGLCLGLAVGSRPTYVAGAVAFIPVLIWQWKRNSSRSVRSRRTLSLIVPFGAILLGLAWYNYARFNNPFEFGLRFQTNATTQAEMRQFSLGFIRYNAFVYYLVRAHWYRYFPFLQPIVTPQAPPGYYGIEYVYGILTNLPFAALAILAPLATWRRPLEERGPLATFTGTAALFYGAICGLLLCFFNAAARYMVDFTPTLMLVACIGLLAVERLMESRMKTAVRIAGGIVAAFSVFVGVMLNFQLHELFRQLNPDLHQRVAHFFDTPVAWWERLAGTPSGPLEISLRFPENRTGKIEPLIATGWSYYSDYLIVSYLDARHVKFGFDHGGHGLIWSPPEEIDYKVLHHLRVQMGSLFPPRAHPFFDGMDPASVEDTVHGLWLLFDGRPVFGMRQSFYDSSLGDTGVGGDPNRAAYGPRFTGTIVSAQRVPPTARAGYGAVELELFFPKDADARPLPLVSTGEAGHGDAFFVRFLRPGVAHFFYDHWGRLYESDDVPVVEGPHILKIAMPSLLAPGATPEAEALRENLRLQLDGRTVWAQEVPFFATTAQKAYFGENRIGASTCEARFAGGMAQPLRQAEAETIPKGATGPLYLELRLPRGRVGRREPLVVTGGAGRGDLFLIRYVDGGHVRFALDHWGQTYMESDLVPIDYGRVHRCEIRLPTLDWAGPTDGGDLTGELEIRIDGAVVWHRKASFYRMPASSLEIGANRIGGSTCEESFTGGMISLGRPNDLRFTRP